MRRRAVAIGGLLVVLMFSGCLGSGSDVEDDAPSVYDAQGRRRHAAAPTMLYEQEFNSTTIRGTLAVRVEVQPQPKETCLVTATGTVVRHVGRFSLFIVSEKHDGTRSAYPYYFTINQLAVTAAGIRTTDSIAPTPPEAIKFSAKLNETRTRALTLYFEDIDATKVPFRLRLQCPHDPILVDVSGSRQAAIVEQTRSSIASVEAELCPDVMAGISALESLHVDGPMRFWMTSDAVLAGFAELTGPGVSKTWDLRNDHPAESVQGLPGDYRVALHRATVDQGSAPDVFAAGIGAFPRVASLEALNDPSTPRQAATDSMACAQS